MMNRLLNCNRILSLAVLIGFFCANSGNVCFAKGPKPQNPAKSTAQVASDQQLLFEKAVDTGREQIRAEIQADDQKEIDRALDGQRSLLTDLIYMIGAGVTALGLYAVFAVRVSRADVKAGMDRLDKEIEYSVGRIDKTLAKAEDVARSAVGDTLVRIKNFEDSVTEEVKGFKSEIKNDFPEIGKLKENLQNLLIELERDISPDTNSSSISSYRNLTAPQRQRILIFEGTVNALKLFVSHESPENRAALSRLYLALARFYLSWFRSAPQGTDLADRAEVYSLESNKLASSKTDGWVVRSAIYLSKFQLGGGPDSKPMTPELADLLNEAQSSAESALRLEPLNLSASVNLAMTFYFRGDLVNAIEASEKARERRRNYSYGDVIKSMPSLYVNLLCYKARLSDLDTDPNKKEALRREVMEIVEEGFLYFSGRGLKIPMKEYLDLISRERGGGGDLVGLGPPLGELLERLKTRNRKLTN